jgi:class 3 adenylate cyclase
MNDDPIGDNHLRAQSVLRTLLCITTIATLGTSASNDLLTSWQIQPQSISLGAAIGILFYLVISLGLTFWLGRSNRPSLLPCFYAIDAALIGVSLSLIEFKFIPSLLLVLMVQMGSLLNGGALGWLRDNLALATGAVVCALLYAPTLPTTVQLELHLPSLIGAVTYLFISAYYNHHRTQTLQEQHDHFSRDNRTLKMRAYKLSRYLSPQIWDAIRSGRDQDLQTERKRLTIFFSDIKDFSQLSEELEAENLTELLNTYLSEMSAIIKKHGGTIDKFMGDGIMVIFGDSNSRGIKQDSLRCVTMAIAMRRRMKELQSRWRDQGIKRPLQIRMGINTGYVTVGTFGTSYQMDYTVLGTHVNLASRLESAAQPGHILLSHETWSLCRDAVICRDKGEITVKGFSHPVKVYQVVGLRKELGRNQSYFEQNLEGFSMHLDTEKLRNYDRTKVIKALQNAAETLKEKGIQKGE